METVLTTPKHSVSADDQIHWKQLWSLAALYASTIIGWIAYQNYQPQLLVQFHFTDFSFLLMIVQGVVVVVTPMIAGRLGDKYRFERGHRLPVISSGISFAAMVFMAVAFTLLGNPGEVFKWILPLLIVFWLVAMGIFTSPALSTMELFTPVDKLPHAMAVLTITGNLVHALEPVIIDLIEFLGAPITFIVGGVVVFMSGYALTKNSLGLFRSNGLRESQASEGNITSSPYAFIFFTGLSVGFATISLFHLFPLVLEERTTDLFISRKVIIVGILVLSALISWPAGKLVNRFGIERTFWLSLCAVVMSASAVYFASFPPLLIVMLTIFTIAFTLLSVASLPLAMRRSAFSEKVFCVGIFFSGAALPEAMWAVLF